MWPSHLKCECWRLVLFVMNLLVFAGFLLTRRSDAGHKRTGLFRLILVIDCRVVSWSLLTQIAFWEKLIHGCSHLTPRVRITSALSGYFTRLSPSRFSHLLPAFVCLFSMLIFIKWKYFSSRICYGERLVSTLDIDICQTDTHLIYSAWPFGAWSVLIFIVRFSPWRLKVVT